MAYRASVSSFIRATRYQAQQLLGQHPEGGEESDPFLEQGRRNQLMHGRSIVGRYYESSKSQFKIASGLLTGSFLNWLLIFVPVAIVAGLLEWNATLTFALNIVGLIPLALLLGNITEILADKFGAVWGGLLNATFGNLVEIILAIQAVRKDLFVVVETSLLGSILSNLLLVSGCCFLFGGLKYKVQEINSIGSSSLGTLLMLSSIAMLLPTAMRMTNFSGKKEQAVMDAEILNVSHYVAIVLILVYICNLIFSLKTHAYLYEIPEDDEEEKPQPLASQPSLPENSSGDATNGNTTQQPPPKYNSQNSQGPPISKSFLSEGQSYASFAREHEEQLSTPFCIVFLLIITVIIAFMSEFITGSVEAVSEATHLSQSFIGLVLLPIAGNACEHITAIIVAMKNKMDLAMQVALGSSLQIALFAVPVVVLFGWMTNHPFSLSFDPFTVVLVVVSMIHANFIVSDAKSNWLEGVQLISVYILIALAFLFMD